MVLLLIANSETLYPSIASYFLEHSLLLGGGRNVVNVIVVDFRGYDTMGEITVLTIAAVGVYTLIKLKQEPTTSMSSLILTTVTRLVFFVVLLFSLYLLLRGHNSPGGDLSLG